MLQYELRNFLSGTGKTKQGNLIEAIPGYLAAGKGAGEKTENSKFTKQEEAQYIIEYITFRPPLEYTD